MFGSEVGTQLNRNAAILEIQIDRIVRACCTARIWSYCHGEGDQHGEKERAQHAKTFWKDGLKSAGQR
jgi:hypothetical protein